MSFLYGCPLFGLGSIGETRETLTFDDFFDPFTLQIDNELMSRHIYTLPYNLHRKRKPEVFEKKEKEKERTPRKKPKNRVNWEECYWNKTYVLGDCSTKREQKLFRRRFRLSHRAYKKLMALIREKEWFADQRWEKPDCCGKRGASLDILVLTALRYLGRGWTFDDCAESTGISEDVITDFFHAYIEMGETKLYPMYVKWPTTTEEIKDSMSEFEEAGFLGCIGTSFDTFTSLIDEMKSDRCL